SKRNWARWRAAQTDKHPPSTSALPIPPEPREAVEGIARVVAAVLEALGYAALHGECEQLTFGPKWQVEQAEKLIADSKSRLVSRCACPSSSLPHRDPSPTASDPSLPHRERSSTAAQPEAYFVLGGANPSKWEETKKVLAEWAQLIVPSDYCPPRSLRFPPGLGETVQPEQAARDLAVHAFRALGRAVIVDLVYLHLYGVGTFHLLPAREEGAFGRRHAGAAGCMRALVCYTADGESTRVYMGELEGVVVHPPRGERPYGFNRLWLPDGYGLTLGEMRHSFFAVHPRLKPLLELAALLRSESAYGSLEGGRGLFELHITVATPSAEQGGLGSFREACGLCGVKAVVIQNERPGCEGEGGLPPQAMTASYVRGGLAQAHRAAFSLSRRLAGMGFDIVRVKVEATFSHPGVPRNKAEAAALSPHNYFECHTKLSLPSPSDRASLLALLSPHGARLSRSALRVLGGGREHRFVTLRMYEEGREGAAAKVEALCASLLAGGYEIVSTIREYAVYDSNVQLDAGWIDPPTTTTISTPPHSSPPCTHELPLPTLPSAPDEMSLERGAIGNRLRRLAWDRVHPLRRIDLSKLASQLRREQEMGRVSARSCEEVGGVGTIYHYKQTTTCWNDALLMARGMVLLAPAHGPLKVVATPFVKFFDLGCDGIELEELYGASVRWEATEKLDGSMGLLFEMRGQWRLITKRAWDSEQARRQAHAMALATCTDKKCGRRSLLIEDWQLYALLVEVDK
ncbi:MAG: hypothetical protein SGPRY_012707, partial [Prymnesium sp.]